METLGESLVPGGSRSRFRVYFEDTDFSGAVYHGSYVRFLERGRSDLLRLAGISHLALDTDGLAFAVSEMALSFRRAARIDDLVEVETSVHKLSGARLVLDQAIRRGHETLVEAVVTVALVDRDGRPQRFPITIRDALLARQTA